MWVLDLQIFGSALDSIFECGGCFRRTQILDLRSEFFFIFGNLIGFIYLYKGDFDL